MASQIQPTTAPRTLRFFEKQFLFSGREQ